MLQRVVIVGGGVSGLAAAYFLRDTGAAVTVLDGADQVGGKLATSEVAGVPVDAGAEALLARRPEGVELIRAVGMADELRYPGTTTASIWTRGEFRPLPRRQVMGVPADMDDLDRSGILSPDGMARARQDADLPATARPGDVSVAEYVAARFGAEVVDRLVDPLLGGVYAGRSDQLSLEATLPALAQVSGRHASLAAAAAEVLGPAGSAPGPAGSASGPAAVFCTLVGGLGSLPEALAKASGADIRTRAMVRELTLVPGRVSGGWRLTVGSAHAPGWVHADAVILALPARPASRLLAGAAATGAGPGAGTAASALGEIDSASMAIITLAYPAAAFGQVTGSGYLIPAVDGRPVKAVTFSSAKWPHLARDGVVIVRCSVGRVGEQAVLRRDDADLARVAAEDLAAATGVTGQPVDARVTRWGGGLPQYTVGHLDRIGRIRAGVAGLGGVAVCGAAYDGVGIPACIASARLAADQIAGYLASPAAERPSAADAGE